MVLGVPKSQNLSILGYLMKVFEAAKLTKHSTCKKLADITMIKRKNNNMI